MKNLLTTPLVLLALLAPLNAGADFDKGLAAYEAEDYATALQEFKKDAEQGDARAQSKLGVMYHFGEGVPQDDKEAVKWYTLAAEQGHAGAQTNLGFMYGNGRGVPQDYKETVKWYTLAAEQGSANAQYNFGLIHDFGEGVPQDDKEAVKWYTLAAEQGHGRAQYYLARKYDFGEGVPQDYKEAVKWYTLAAEQGNARAQSGLGYMYDFGYGVPEDDVQAVKWYTLAAEQGDADAQRDLGYLYSRGHGVAVDYSKADLLFKDSLGEIEASSLLSAAFWGRVGIYTAENAFGYGLPLAVLLILLHIFAKRLGWPAYLRFFSLLLCGGFIGLGLVSYLALKGWLFEFFGIALAVYGLIRLFRGRRAKCPHCGFQNGLQRLNFATAGDRNAFYSDDTSKKVALKFECKKCKTDFIKEYKLRELTGTPPV